MNLIEKFQVNKNQSIEILIPDIKDKTNIYYGPTEGLHRFDEIFVVFKDINNTTKVIGQDMAYIIIEPFKDILERIITNEIALPDNIKLGELGYHYNIDMNKDEEELVDYSDYSIWSGGFATRENNQRVWMYNYNNKIYLEVSPIYPWLYEEPEKNQKVISFDEFSKSYKPILVQEISREIAQEWLDKCNKILEKMVKP